MSEHCRLFYLFYIRFLNIRRHHDDYMCPSYIKLKLVLVVNETDCITSP